MSLRQVAALCAALGLAACSPRSEPSDATGAARKGALGQHAGHDEPKGHDEHAGHEKHAGHGEHAGEGAQDEHTGDGDAHADEGAEHAEHGEHGEHTEPGEGHAHEDEPVRLSPAGLARSGIVVARAAKGVFVGGIELLAEVNLNPDKVAHISPLMAGQLQRVDVTLGDAVAADQPLAQLRSVDLGQARAALGRTNALRDVARKTMQRQERLRREGISSERSLLEAQLAYAQASAEREAAQSRLNVFGVKGGAGSDMALTSPIAGVVLERHATRGENVTPEDTLFVVADVSRVWVIGNAYEPQIARIAPGMVASLALNAWPGQVWTGKVDHIGAAMDEQTRTLPIRVELDNPDGRLRPGLTGTLRLAAASEAELAVLVPREAVQQVEGRPSVFVPADAPGSFIARPVRVGREDATSVEIISGLQAGELVVIKGAFVLKSEQMRSELGHGHAH